MKFLKIAIMLCLLGMILYYSFNAGHTGCNGIESTDCAVHDGTVVNTDIDGKNAICNNGYGDSYQINYKFDTVLFNPHTNTPNWVKWKVTVDKLYQKRADRKNYDFTADTLNVIDRKNEVSSDDYTGSGYDRGHMAPAADMAFSKVAMRECHYMTNICPQTGDLNRGIWKSLEDRTRVWCAKYDVVYVVAGPIYTNKDTVWIGKKHKVAVPDKYFKVIMTKKKGFENAIGFVFDNKNPSNNLNKSVCSVDDIERITGYDFFSWLPDDIENKVEQNNKISTW